MRRRQVLKLGLQACAVASARYAEAQTARAFRFGTTPVFLDDQAGFLGRWAQYLGEAMDTKVEFVQRRTYRDIMALLGTEAVDAAWICGFPWVVNKAQLHGISVPRYRGAPLYQSYLIVPSGDTTSASPLDMRGKVFAYSDPDSNSGYLVPRTSLIQAGADPNHFFSRTFFTWGHRNVVQAVATGLAQAGAVDGYVWDTLQLVAPAMTAKTRVAWRSAWYGFPPIATRSSLDALTEQRFASALLGMDKTPVGQRLLNELNLGSFGAFQPEVFDGIVRLVAVNSRA